MDDEFHSFYKWRRRIENDLLVSKTKNSSKVHNTQDLLGSLKVTSKKTRIDIAKQVKENKKSETRQNLLGRN